MRRAAPAAAVAAFSLALALAASVPAHAVIPDADRVESAIATTNRSSARNQPLRIDLELHIDGGPSVGSGELVTHPTGLARLELRGRSGLVERHLLRGDELLATRNGEFLDDPRRFLAPLFLLQIDSSTAMRAALGALGADPDSIALAPCGDNDCFVIGDPRRELRRLAEDDPSVEEINASLRGAYATLWVEVAEFEVLGIQTLDGVKVRLGPSQAFERVRIPAWIEIEEPERGVVRFDVRAVSRVDAPASAFGEGWVMSPGVPSPYPGQTTDP